MDKDRLLEDLAVLRCPGKVLDTLPGDLVVIRQAQRAGAAALVREPERVRRLLPDAVLDRLTLDELMQFYSGKREG